MTKQTYAKHHRIFDYQGEMQDEKDKDGKKTGKKVFVVTNIEKRAERLPAKPRETYTFEMDGLRVSVLMSDGQVINKYKAFKRFCEARGGYGTAIREQNMLDPKDLSALTQLDEKNRIVAPVLE